MDKIYSSSEISEIIYEVKYLSVADEMFIHENLGRDLIKGSADQQPTYYVEIAKKWLAEKNDVIKRVICRPEVVDACQSGDATEVIQLIVSALCAHFSQPAEVASIAALIVRRGVNHWCGQVHAK